MLTVPGLRCCGQRGGFNSRATGAEGACPGLGPRICKIVAITVAARFLLTPRSNDGDSQPVTVPDAAGSAAASTAGALAPMVPVPGWYRGGCKDRCRHARRAF